MVHLVLERLGEQVVLGLDAEGAAFAVERLDGDGLGARYLGDVAGHGKTALFEASLAGALDELRVDEDDDFFFAACG